MDSTIDLKKVGQRIRQLRHSQGKTQEIPQIMEHLPPMLFSLCSNSQED